MRHNKDGFLVPQIDDAKCVKCGACLNVCQSVERVNLNIVENGIHYIAQNKDYKRTKQSASGGAFLGIATYVIKELKGVVYGASITESNEVKHIGIESIKDICLLQKSKYVQSDLGNTYREVAKHTKNCRYVLFCGTPCQVAGLYKYNKCDKEYLITIDIICHGVPSPKLFSYCLEGLSSTHGKIKNIQFRCKNPYFKSGSSFIFKAKADNCNILQLPEQNPYFNIFLKGYAFRETCYKCPYAQINRIGDFTIGDCDSHTLYPNFHSNESNSTLMLNTAKASNLWKNGLNRLFDYGELDIVSESLRNKQLSLPFSRPMQRTFLYDDMRTLDYNSFSLKYSVSQSPYHKIKLLISFYAPPVVFKLKSHLNKFLRHGREKRS